MILTKKTRFLALALAGLTAMSPLPGCRRDKAGKESASNETGSAPAAKVVEDKPAIPLGNGGFFDLLKPSEAHAQAGGEAWTPDAPVEIPAAAIKKIVTTLEDKISRPGISIDIKGFRKSKIKGLLIGDAVLGAQGKTVTQQIYASTDGRWVSMAGVYKLNKVTAADFPGFKIVEFDKIDVQGDEDRTEKLMVSEDGQYMSFSDWTDTSSDPRTERMKMVTLDNAPRQGAKKGKVTIVEFSDFQCPFCDRAANTMRKEVYPEYKDKVTFYFKHLPLPFHKWAGDAAIAAMCVKRDGGDEAFWKLYSYYFDNQKSLDESNLRDKTYEFTKTLGLNAGKLKGCIENRETQGQLQKDMAEAEALGISGTPGFLVNGKKMSGAQPYTAFKAEIDAALNSN